MTTRPFFGAGRVACGCEFFHRRSRWREAWDAGPERGRAWCYDAKLIPGFDQPLALHDAYDATPAVCEAREREFEIRPLISPGKRPPRLPTGVIWVSNVDCSA